MFRKYLPTLIILVAIGGVATARNCHQFFAAPVVQQVVAYPQVYYSVGGDLQTEALIKKAVREEFQALRAELRQQQTTDPQSPPPTNSALAANCSKCHSGPNAKAGIVYDGSPLKCSDITKALRAIAADKMPKGAKIDGATKGALMQELLDSEPKEQLPPHPAPPVPPKPSPDLE